MFGAQAPEHGEGHDALVKVSQSEYVRFPLPLVTDRGGSVCLNSSTVHDVFQ
jgi:hypothetical protein